jgi:putative acyl-CoA dehydrogenase
MSTHDVMNQVEPLADTNLFATDRALRDALACHAPDIDAGGLAALGALAGSATMQRHARLANVHAPQLRTHDRVGRRVDEVEFHPGYHALMAAACEAGLHGAPWADAAPHAHLRRAAGFMLFTQLEPSVLCPVSMTYAVAPALRGNAAIAGAWLPKLTHRGYDARDIAADGKPALTMGMGMTEKQGGSDVRANTTRAEPDGTDAWGERARITGHKWFFSAPMCDAHLVLAQESAGLSCWFVPRRLADGTRNAIAIQRLKDKLGNRANASSEVEFEGAVGWRVGEPGRGVPQILEMGVMTRLDCALGTAGLMRQATALALHHCRQRKAFGRRLIEQPLMKNVLADIALESEAATALALRLAASFDPPSTSPGRSGAQRDRELALRRVLTPVAKFWICKRGAALAQEAMECLGGNGYVEEDGEGTMARIYREMPLNSIWEGAGNIMALDLLRTFRKGDAVLDALQHELRDARGAHGAFDALADALPERIHAAPDETDARALARDVALAVQASLLHRHAPPEVFSTFCASRLARDAKLGAFGTLPSTTPFDALLARALPA